MCGRLRRVLLIGPRTVGWDASAPWRELGYRRPPDPEAAAREHRGFRSLLVRGGASVLEPGEVAEGLTPDAVYCHDASFPSQRGMILMRPGKELRRREPEAHGRVFRAQDIPVAGAIRAPGVAEAGDLVWLDEATVLAGEGYRTNAAGIAQLRELLAPDGVEVVPVPLPHGDGPGACLHLMSLLSVLDSRTLVADPRFLPVPTLEFLRERDFRLLTILESERETMAANVLALGGGTLVAIARNRGTNARLREAGFEVWTYEGDEISANGSGGPTCLTRPFVRDST